jgi:hypothetical protein
MGIPSYFSYIIKNHVKIVRALVDVGHIQHLFMDCNSIIYDAVHKLLSDDDDVLDEDVLIAEVIEKIRHYVDYIRPTKTLYIAFDGVAPLAKMDQQRTRRHKTLWTTTTTSTPSWSTSHITPGTAFMQHLSERVAAAFLLLQRPSVECVIVSGSTECGEGEHKLFQHIRKSCRSNTLQDNAAVYGLDSDLIMLSLFHCQHFKKLYVFRETPEFVKSQISCYSPSDPCHFLDIDLLATAILRELGGQPQNNKNKSRIYDYVFMCFFLGNDFLPHFPSLNLRTHGLSVLLEAHRAVFGRSNSGLVDESKTIVWSQVQRFVQHLAKQEMELWKQEYEVRAKWGNRQWSTANEKDLDFVLQNAPVIYRAEELYIAPDQMGWEARYYKALFAREGGGGGVHRSVVCQNYYDGLAWVFQYYTEDCVNWRFKYPYDYPPLLCDLAMTLPKPSSTVMTAHPPFPPSVQLAYVTPQPLHAVLLEPAFAEYLAANFAELFVRPNNSFQWAFCRYFWESHVVLPEISLETMEQWTLR